MRCDSISKGFWLEAPQVNETFLLVFFYHFQQFFYETVKFQLTKTDWKYKLTCLMISEKLSDTSISFEKLVFVADNKQETFNHKA